MPGYKPSERPMDIHIKYGVAVIDKPAGPTSHQVSAWVRDMLGKDKAGHSGTLDPGVTGVLPVAMENSLRVLHVVLEGYKEYIGVMRFHRKIDKKLVKDMFKEFTGDIYQYPPMRSAVKRQLRTRKIHKLSLLEIDDRDFLFHVRCESGTYIRTLCRDIGDALGVGGNMECLRRIQSADITEKDMVTLQELLDAWTFWKEDGNEKHLRQAIKPVEILTRHIPGVILKENTIDAICHGAPLAAPGIEEISKDYNKGDTIALYSTKGELVAVATATVPSLKAIKTNKGIVAEPDRVVMDPGTYPRSWKKH